jgi:hypothetical protein
MDVVYILSPARSGSTFLQFLLGGHEQIIPLGEVSHVLQEYCRTRSSLTATGHCSCGSLRQSCPFWGAILKKLPILTPQDGFRLILERSSQVYPAKILVDASKSGVFLEEHYLNHIQQGNRLQIRLRIIFLVRDFRGWVTSIRNHRVRKGEGNFWKKSRIISSYRWLYTSIKWLYRVRNLNLPFLPVYYEHLVFNTERELRRIYDFLGLVCTRTIALSPQATHELYGSPTMKADTKNLSQIVYDTQWMKDWRFALYGPILSLPIWFNYWYADRIGYSQKAGE